MSQLTRVALTIAGSDTSGGAGLQLDLKAFAACRVHGLSVATALTAQSSRGVRRVHHVPPRFVAAQIDALAGDFPIHAAKTGMLARAQVVAAVVERIERRGIGSLVVDPVILAKDGTPLLSRSGLELLRRELLPRALAVTPNIPEAEALSGVSIHDEASLRSAAERILATGVTAVIIKGGHRPDAPTDTLFLGDEVHSFPGPRLEGAPVHGTGCCYSALLTARIALGEPLPEACGWVKRCMERVIGGAGMLGGGSRMIGDLREAVEGRGGQ